MRGLKLCIWFILAVALALADFANARRLTQLNTSPFLGDSNNNDTLAAGQFSGGFASGDTSAQSGGSSFASVTGDGEASSGGFADSSATGDNSASGAGVGGFALAQDLEGGTTLSVDAAKAKCKAGEKCDTEAYGGSQADTNGNGNAFAGQFAQGAGQGSQTVDFDFSNVFSNGNRGNNGR